jgi:signal transduction histidine kinase
MPARASSSSSAAFRAVQRAPANLALYVVVGLLVCALPLVPGMHATLALTTRQLAPWVAACIAATFTATALYHRLGDRALVYRLTALGEGMLLQIGLVVMVVVSRHGANLLWLPYVSYGAINGGITEARRILGALVVAPPLVAAGVFLFAHHDPAGAVASVLASAIAALVFLASSRANLRLEAEQAAREAAQAALAELQLRDERTRIARDLHDGAAADLAAIVWKAEALRAEASVDLEQRAQLDALVARASEGIDELRSIVWSLRRPSQPWDELVAYVRQRCHELCDGRVALQIVADDEEATHEVPGALATELLRVAQEAVRNALRHARAAHIAVRLSPGPPLEIVVEDDGLGVPEEAIARSRGGLSHFRARAQACGGDALVERLTPGTRIRATLAHAPPANSTG